MILITGANGHLGTLAIDSLIAKKPSLTVTGLVRSKEKGDELKKRGVELRIGDYTDKPSIEKALDGIDTLLLISSSSLNDRAGQHQNVIEAAKEQGVGHIVYTSIVQADKLLSPLSPDHFETEKMIKASGLPYTIHRHTFYTEFLPMGLGNSLETGEWYFPSDGKKVNFAYRTDMAEALANVLSAPDKHRGEIYEITSATSHTLNELAEVIGDAAGKTIRYVDISIDDFKQQLEEAGLPEDVIGMSLAVARSYSNGALSLTSGDLEKLLGRKPKETSAFIREFIEG